MKKELKVPKQARDLRRFPRVNHAKLVDLRKKALQNIQLLATLLKSRTANQIATKRVSNYFQGISRYDEGIADNNVTYIKDKLDNFTKRADELSQDLGAQIKSILTEAITGLTLDEIGDIVIAINPPKLFEGPGGSYESAVKMAKKAQKAVKGGMALARLADVISDTGRLATDFQENRKQMSSMEDISRNIQGSDKAGITQFAAKFIENFSNYDPKVTRSRLAKNDVLWATFKELACDLLLSGVKNLGKVVALCAKN